MAQKRKDYIPTDKYELEKWATQFVIALQPYLKEFGISEGQYSVIQQASGSYASDLVTERQLIDKKRKQVKTTQADRKELEKQSRSIAQIIKNSPSYTEAIGKDLDIIGTEVQINTNTAKPVLTAKKVPHGWEFSFGLNGYFNGVNIYRKHPGDDQFSYIATDTRSPYVDNSPAENGTRYYAYFILGDTEVGQQSDVITIEV